MQLYEAYTEQGSPRQGERAYREVLLFQLINHFDDHCQTDAERSDLPPQLAGGAFVDEQHLTVEQKRRLRNDIYRRGVADIKAHNEALAAAQAEGQRMDEPMWDTYYTRVFIDAFFKTDYGRQYLSYKNEWSEDGEVFNAYEAAVGEWVFNDDNPASEPRHTVISPYDPMFAGADLFDDNADELGYVIGSLERNANGYVLGPDGMPALSQRNVTLQGQNHVITAVQLGRNRTIAPFSDLARIAQTEPVERLGSDLTMSGYNAVKHYIRTKEDKEAVRKFLLAEMEKPRTGENGQLLRDRSGNPVPMGPISAGEEQFMGDVCRLLSERGLDFGVRVGGDGNIVAEVKNPKAEIRLLSRGDEQYQGRIYADGIITRLGVSDAGQGNAALFASTITPEDRLNLIRWYFGDTVMVNDERNRIPGMSGSGYKHPVGDVRHRIQVNNSVFNTVSLSTGRGADNSIVFGVRRVPGTDNRFGVINIMQRPSTVTNANDLPETSFAKSITLPDVAFRATTNSVNPSIDRDERIPLDKLLSGHYIEATDEEGNLVRARRIRINTDPNASDEEKAQAAAEMAYYRHVIVRDKLESWVESAKANHAKMVDIDGMIAYYRDVYSVTPEEDFDFSEDDDVKEVQQVYWDILTGKTNIGSNDLEDKIADIRARYAGYVDDAFGEVPEIPFPGRIEDPMPSPGFNPGMVSRYVNTADSYGIQKNQSFIRHMLLRLEDDYDPSFIRGDDYVASSMRNALVKFDQDTVKADFTMLSILNGVNGSMDSVSAEKVAGMMQRMPLTREMMVHAGETLMHSGVHPASIRLRVDENGIIEYTGYATTAKNSVTSKGRLRDYASVVNEIRSIQAANGVPPEKQMQNATFDSELSLPAHIREDDPLYGHLHNDVEALQQVHGYIGQIFEPDRYGAIRQNTVTPDNRVLIPGFDAYLMEDDPENPKPMSERLRLMGLSRQLRKNITSSIHKAVFTMGAEYNFEPHGADLNVAYRQTYDTVLDAPYYERMMPKTTDVSKMTEEERFFLRVIETMQGRCRFPNEYGEGSTTMAQSYLEHPTEDAAKQFDYYYSDLCENHNLRVLGREFDNIFDRDMTGTAKTQGLVRYLVRGAKVNPDGTVAPVVRGRGVKEPHCALAGDPLFSTMYFNSWDRRQMAMSQSITALGTPRHVGVAMMNIAGYNFDDAMPVSKAFAEAHPIMGADGNMRPLMVQDKLSDASGNKGVISAVVDPDLYSGNIARKATLVPGTETAAGADYLFNDETYHVRYDRKSKDSKTMQAAFAIQKQLGVYGKDPLMKFFADNPNVEIVMAPYSGMSRTNGGIARELMKEPGDVVIDGKTVKGGMGYTNIIIVDMPADVKTHWYDEEAIRAGKGRKASGQLAWALQSKGCNAIMREFYGQNQSALDDMREYAISVGLDFNENMEPVLGYHPQTARGERRALIKLPDLDSLEGEEKYFQSLKRGEEKQFAGFLDYAKLTSTRKDTPHIRLQSAFLEDQKAYITKALNEHGGFMELPFQLDFKTGEYSKLSGSVIPDYLFKMQETGQFYNVGGADKPTYGMPVLPIGLRSGQEFQDGTSMQHDYTTRYQAIYRSALQYMACERELAAGCPPEREAILRSGMEKAKAAAQKNFDKVVSHIVENRFDTKYNVIREGVMSARVKNSATAVWSPDPRLNIDEVSMSTEHAKGLGLIGPDGKLEREARVLVWRDPILHDDNVRYLKVVIDDNVHGVCVHPTIDKCFDGDYDGDSVAIVNLTSREARAEAYRAFSMDTNLLQKGVLNKDGKTHPLYIQTGLDVATAMYLNPELKNRLDTLTANVNTLEEKAAKYLSLQNPTEDDANEIKATTRVRRKNQAGTGYVYVQNEVNGKPAINALRKQYREELNGLIHEALSGIGTAHIVVENEKTLVESVQAIVDSGAKGNQSKMRDYMDNVGIQYDCGIDDRAIPSSARSITKNGKPCSRNVKDGVQREVDMAIQETAAYKADNTSLGGTTAQNGVSAFRDYNLMAALELTYPITQAILQSKHDPKDAKIKDEIVRFWGKDVWDGYKLTGDFTGTPEEIQNSPHKRIRQYVLDANGEKIPRKVRTYELDENGQKKIGENGRPIVKYQDMVDRNGNVVYETTYQKCTPQEWVEQMTGMMKALKVDVNPQYIQDIAKVMTRMHDTLLKSADTGFTITTFDKSTKSSVPVMGNRLTVAGLTDFAAERGSFLDRMAYTGRYTAMVSEALKKDPMYRETMTRMGRAIELKQGGLSSVMSNAVADALAVKEQEDALRKAKADGDKDAETAAKDELRRIRGGTRPSASFAPKQFQQELAGDAERRTTGSDTNTFVKVKGGEEITISAAPRPVGSRNCRLSQEDYDAGGTYMMESQAAYDKRMGIARTASLPFNTPEMNMAAQAQAPQPAAITSDNPFSGQLNRMAAGDALGVSNIHKKSDGDMGDEGSGLPGA